MVDVAWKIITTALFAAFDEYETSRMRKVLGLQGTYCRETSEDCVAIVCTATSIKPSVFFDGSPGAKAVLPTGEFGLLIEVAVHQDVAAFAWDVDKDKRGASLEANDSVY